VEEFTRALPRRWRYRDGESKVTLRRVYKKYFPEKFWQTKKRYFTFPLHDFLSHDDYRLVRENLSSSRLRSENLIDAENAKPWIERYLRGDRRLVFKIWSLLVLHAWVQGRFQSGSSIK
jgi:asparagine synthase (glutamine-hydrolysing)